MTTYSRQKSLKIPKGQSISENLKRTEHTMDEKEQKDKHRSTKHYTEN